MFSYDRNIRISRPQRKPANIEPARRSQRVSVPVKRYNCGVVTCCVCMKRFRDDFPIEHYDGAACAQVSA